jgi:hypothetical protein
MPDATSQSVLDSLGPAQAEEILLALSEVFLHSAGSDSVAGGPQRRKVAQEMALHFLGSGLAAGPSLRDEMLTIGNFTGHPSLTLRAGFVEVAEARSDWAPDLAHPLPEFSPPALRRRHGGARRHRIGARLPCRRRAAAGILVWSFAPPGVVAHALARAASAR